MVPRVGANVNLLLMVNIFPALSIGQARRAPAYILSEGITMDCLETYLSECERRGLKPGTIYIYRTYLTAYLKANPVPSDRASLLEHIRTRYNNDQTRHAAFRSIKTFIRWQSVQGFCSDWISAIRYRVPEPPPKPTLSVAEFERIMNAISTETSTGLRDRALFSLMFYVGLRRDGARLLRKSQVDLEAGCVHVKTKCDKEAYLSMPSIVVKRVTEWLDVCAKGPEYLFHSMRRPSRPIEARHVNQRLENYSKMAGLSKHVHPHLLRHSFATIMAEHDVPLDVLQAALMHSSLQMTHHYINKLRYPRRIKDAVTKVFG